MEDQGKRLMLAVAIAFGIMMVWSVVFPPEKPKKKPEADTQAQVQNDARSAEVQTPARRDRESPPSAEPRDGDEAVAAPTEAAKSAPRGEEKFYDFEFDNLKVRFSSYGAALSSWQLLEPRLRDLKSGEPEDMIRVKEEGHPHLRVWFADSTYNIPKDAEWVGEKKNNTQMRFVWESNDIRVVKEITLHPEEYLAVMEVSLELVNAPEAKQALAVTLYSAQDPKTSGGGMFDRVERLWTSACFDDEIHTRSSKKLAKKGEKRRTGDYRWGGFDHAYFLNAGAFKPFGDGHARIDCNAYPLEGIYGGMGLDLVQDSQQLKNGEPGLRGTLALYMGPKYGSTLEKADSLAGYPAHFDESIDLGFLAIIAGPLLSLLNFFQGFVVNWGLAILLLTIVVKGLTLPWTHKSMKSMQSMAKLKPQLEKIKEKYKDDRQKQNLETMNLFKAHKVNPMSGCLPMLLQMPIWFALYRALTVAGELYQAPFIAGWIDDLTLPDPYHVMPVLLTGMMFLQTRLTPSTGSGAQQKMLMYGMPIMFGAFSFVFPAGLTLYIFTNTCFTAAHHLYMHKTDGGPAAVAAGASADKVIDVDSSEESASSGDEDEDSSAAGEAKKTSGTKAKKKSGSKGTKGKKSRKR